MNNEWVIYEIPGYKVGMCKASNYPRRPRIQVNGLMGYETGKRVSTDNYKMLQSLCEITESEAKEVETEWQDKLGYRADVDTAWLIGKSSKGKEISEWHKSQISKHHTGKLVSDETRAKISSVKKGKPFSEEHRKSISNAKLGTTLSDEHKAKISASGKGRVVSQETLEKRSASLKESWRLRKLKLKEGPDL